MSTPNGVRVPAVKAVVGDGILNFSIMAAIPASAYPVALLRSVRLTLRLVCCSSRLRWTRIAAVTMDAMIKVTIRPDPRELSVGILSSSAKRAARDAAMKWPPHRWRLWFLALQRSRWESPDPGGKVGTWSPAPPSPEE